jgi:general secretion pathway protein G
VKLVTLLLIVCATSCERPADDQTTLQAHTQIACFKTALDSFKRDCGRFPSTTEGLAALTTRPADMKESRWRGPYLDATAPKDPWGHDYIYRCPTKRNTNAFDLYSLGKDGGEQERRP